jgi:hypothetical protein
MDIDEVERRLAVIDQHASDVAEGSDPGSAVNALAFAVHTLVGVVSDIADEVHRIPTQS